MGKEIKVLCDCCGTDVYGQRYYTLCIRKIIHGKQTINPTLYLCPKCFRETKLSLLLCDIDNTDKGDS